MILHTDPLRESDLPAGCVATIGNFDGMHVGHQEIVRRVVARGRELGAPSALITFSPHPLSIVAPDRVPRQILTIQQKEELLADTGLDAVLVIPFTPEFSRWSAQRFVDEFLVARLHVREIQLGRDFCFGAGREGTLESLADAGRARGFTATSVEDVRVRGIRVSSSIVRNAIAKGAMRSAALALGRTYFVDGRVETGRRLGRRLGFPTVNLAPYNDLFPGSGVYITTCRFNSFSRSFESVTNIGVRPTLYENYAVTIESHILDFDSNVYEDEARIYFHELIRREKRFRSPLELTNQIRKDIEASRLYFLRPTANLSLEQSLLLNDTWRVAHGAGYNAATHSEPMNRRFALCSFLALIAASFPLFAQYQQNPELDKAYKPQSKFSFDFSSAAKGGTVKWSARHQEIVKDEYAILDGDVVVAYRDVKITADRITVNLKTKDADALGNVIIDQGSNRLSAEHVIFNLDSKTGTLFNARASFDPSIYFAGAKIEKLDDKTFRLTDGVFTSCDIDNPAWSFRVTSGLVTMDDYARLKNLSFRAKKLPMFWTPYLVWPTKKDRSRGFMIPKFGSSSRYGTLIGLRYFIPYKEWADATILGDYYSDGYYGFGTEVRYVPSKTTMGRLQAYAITDPLAAETGTDKIKWRYSFQHTQDDLPGGFRGVIDVRNFSDLEFFRRFENDFEINTISNIYSSAYLTKNSSSYSLNIRADRREQFTGSTSQVFEQLPSIQFKMNPDRVASSPLYFALESSAGYLRSDQTDYFRTDFFPTLSLQLRTPPWFALKPQLLGRATYYTASRDATTGAYVNDSIERTYGQGQIEIVGPSFSRIFNHPLGDFAKFKHVIEPRVRYIHTTDVSNQDQVIRFDTVDSPFLPLAKDYMEYSLVQRIIAKGSEQGSSAREILSFTIKQAASFSGPFDPTATIPSDYTPIGLSLRANPYQNITLDASAAIGNESRDLQQASVSANLMGPKRYLNFRWFANYNTPELPTIDSSQFQVRAGSPIIPDKLRGDVQLSWDAERRTFLEQRYVMGYFASCWGVRLEYRDLTVPVATHEYVVSFSLQNIGTVVDFRGSVGPGF